MSEPAKVFEDREIPGKWRVECVGDDSRDGAPSTPLGSKILAPATT